MTPNTDSTPAGAPQNKKPHLALAIATVLGVGFLSKAPGTFGSLVGVIVAIVAQPLTLAVLILSPGIGMETPTINGHPASWTLLVSAPVVFLVLALIGVWAASRVANYSGAHDPQHVVIDEVSGQHLALLLALFPFTFPAEFARSQDLTMYALYFAYSLLNWKYLLAGFILFRVFDIWKPYPVRRLEKLPGGWGIMADDWMAGVYAAVVLRLMIHLGLV